MKIEHLAIWSANIEMLKNFYISYFNCTANRKYENTKKGFSSYFLTFDCGARLELMQQKEISDYAPKETIGLAHFAISIGTEEKVKTLTHKLQHDGYRVLSPPRNTGDGYFESLILDPEGNRIELSADNVAKVEKATFEDLSDILYLQKCCYLMEAELYNDFNIPPLLQTQEDIEQDFANQTILKLHLKGRIIGSVRAFEKNDTCYIGKLIVERKYQNCGYGKMLLNSIENEFNTSRFELFTGHKSEKNLSLYTKLGFNEFKKENLQGITLKFLEKKK